MEVTIYNISMIYLWIVNTQDSKIYSIRAAWLAWPFFSRASRRLVTRVQPHSRTHSAVLFSRGAGRGLSQAEHSRLGRGEGGACNAADYARNERDREGKKKKERKKTVTRPKARTAAERPLFATQRCAFHGDAPVSDGCLWKNWISPFPFPVRRTNLVRVSRPLYVPGSRFVSATSGSRIE